MAVNVWGLVAIIVFYILIFALGIYAYWKNKQRHSADMTSEDVILAGRNIGVYLGIFTMTATWVDGSLISGVAEGVYTSGYAALQMPLGYLASIVLAGAFYVKKMRGKGYVTMLDPLGRKFGKVMAAILFFPAMSGDLFWCAATLSSLGTTLTVVVGLEDWISILVSALVVLVYTFFGGLYSVSYTDVMQMVFIFLGLWVAIPFICTSPYVTPLPETADRWVGTLDPRTLGTYVDVLLQLMLGGIPWQFIWQRILAVKTARMAQMVTFAGSLGGLLATIPPLLIGMAAVSADWNATSYDGELPFPHEDLKLIAPLVLQHLTPFAVAVVGLAAVSAAVMSSADSIMLSSSSMFTNNVYKPLRDTHKTRAGERELIWSVRLFMVAFAVVTTVLAIFIKSIFALTILSSDLIYVIMFPQLTSALFLPAANVYGSITGLVLASVIRPLAGEPALSLSPVIKWPWYDPESHTQYFPHRTACMLISFLGIILVSYVTDFLFRNEYLHKRYDFLNGVEIVRETEAPSTPDDKKNLKLDWSPNPAESRHEASSDADCCEALKKADPNEDGGENGNLLSTKL
ncbi:high-affinity choline transporter 1-like [Lingula anatina]|uniref:High-affinity choline transporter 1-like n=1 Tax=Lingula anatina TaxID=7574 RepID=A0A1S3K5R5_LINAN|nr:high-affinity choline transporter 1-like [Lingula anatina]|eukprot:XP_013417978.1 high-affinity choline transporter 1-like [Lingula anatina]